MLTINATGDTTLHTAGKYCPEDILVKVPTGGGSGGSSGASVETCTVTITCRANIMISPELPTIVAVAYSAYDGNNTHTIYENQMDVTSYNMTNVVCGSFIYIAVDSSTGVTLENARMMIALNDARHIIIDGNATIIFE